MATVLNLSKDVISKDKKSGVWRVRKTRVSVDSVVHAFDEGATAEEIVLRFPTLHLVDVYSVISYYLQNRSAVERYLSNRRKTRARTQKEFESQFSPSGIRHRLLSRRRDK